MLIKDPITVILNASRPHLLNYIWRNKYNYFLI